MADMRNRLILALLCLATTVTASSQQPGSGTLSGRVLDVAGATIAGADVFVHSRSSSPKEMKLAAHTNRSGQFDLSLLAGAYDVLIVSPSFLAGAKTIVISSGNTTHIQWKLKVASCDFPGMNCDTFK